MRKSKIYVNPANGIRINIKEGFNWWVLFLGSFWYIFNRMIIRGFIWGLGAILAYAITLRFGGAGSLLIWIIAGFSANEEKERKLLSQGWKFVDYAEERT